MTSTERISMGANDGTPQCSTCAYRKPDGAHPGWGWCTHSRNRADAEGARDGFTPSVSPSGTCVLHPARIAASTADHAQGDKA